MYVGLSAKGKSKSSGPLRLGEGDSKAYVRRATAKQALMILLHAVETADFEDHGTVAVEEHSNGPVAVGERI